MDLQNQKNSQQTSDQLVGHNPQICPECNQSYMFESECPACNGKIRDASEALTLAVHIKNIMDHMGMADLYECNLEDLRKADSLITNLFK